MPELWNVMIHPSGRGSVGGRPRPAPKTHKKKNNKPSVFNTFYNVHITVTTTAKNNQLSHDLYSKLQTEERLTLENGLNFGNHGLDTLLSVRLMIAVCCVFILG